MEAVLSWFFNIFLMWIQEEWERESFLFASLSIESIYAFYVLFHSIRFFVHILLMASGFVCSSFLSLYVRFLNWNWDCHFLNNNNEAIERGCEIKRSQLIVLVRTRNFGYMSCIYTQTFTNFKKWLNRTSTLYATALVYRARQRKRKNIHLTDNFK